MNASMFTLFQHLMFKASVNEKYFLQIYMKPNRRSSSHAEHTEA